MNPFINQDEPKKEQRARIKDCDDTPQKLKSMQTRTVEFDFEKCYVWWLLAFERNRPMKKTDWKALAKKMVVINGVREFKTTSQGISITKKGKIQDGHNRLIAIMMYYAEYNTLVDELKAQFGNEIKCDNDPSPVALRVTEGEDEHFQFFDQGRNRSALDVFDLEGEANAKELAIAARLLWLRVHGKRVAGGGKLSPYQLHEFQTQHPGLKDSLEYILSFGIAEDSFPCREVMSPGYAATLHYLMCNCLDLDDPTDLANEFWRQVIDQDADKKTPTRILYTVLKKAKSNDEKNRDFKLSRDSLVDHCIQAFNDWTEGASYTKIPLSDDFKPGLGGLDGSLVPEDIEDEG